MKPACLSLSGAKTKAKTKLFVDPSVQKQSKEIIIAANYRVP